jgi:hypothetical protein
MNKPYIFLAGTILLIFSLFFSCSSENVSGSSAGNTWLISENLIKDGGPGKDGIPAIGNPKFISAQEVNFLKETDLVLLVKFGNEVRAYPHPILDWHEIINDNFNNHKISVTYCPLTGSGLVFNRMINGNETTFGVSGLLYNSNLIPYDRLTDSNWSQMLFTCVNGPLIGMKAELIPVIETTWETARKAFPDVRVVSTETGYNRNYSIYPYGNYKTSDQLLFAVKPLDTRLPKKERVFGIISDNITMVVPISTLTDSIEIITKNIGDTVIIAGSRALNFAIAFHKKVSFGTVELSPVNNSLPVIMEDQYGNRYNLFGEIVAGPQQGQKLEYFTGYIAYWFAWGAIWPNAVIFRGGNNNNVQ